jgi:succinate dehydrogenase / fumarate reductase flavoprotein subunit
MAELEHHDYDVVIIGAGGAGLRAAIAAQEAGARTAVICKSLLGKAHTVMAEGGIAASMGNVYSEDNWKVHYRDTMRGGKLLNHWRMAQIHAQEAPDRVWELEQWGALFDRTPEGLISQRDFGGHRYARLAHVGDRTGLEMIRTLQQRTVELGIDVFMECTVTDLLKDGDRIAGAFAYWRESGRFIVFKAPSVVLATGGIGKSYKVTSNSWEYTGDGHALALRAGASLVNMEFVHPRVLQGRDGRHRGRRGPLVPGQAQQPPPSRAPAARRGGPRHQQRDQGRTRLAPRRGVPRYRQPAQRRVHPEAASVHVRPVQGAGRGRHHG